MKMSERGKLDQKYETRPGVFRQKGRGDVEVFSSAATAALGKLLKETGYFPAEPRITYVFLFFGGGKWGLGERAVNGFPPVRQQELWRGSCCLPRKTLRHPDTQNKNAQAHNMTVLRISSYHAAKTHCFSEKQPHKMSFYQEFIIICEGNERAGQAGLEIMHKAFFFEE